MISVVVRAFEPGDEILINKWRNDPVIQSMTGGMIRKVSLELEKEWVREKMLHNYNEIYWAVCLNDECGKMIGYTSINNIDYINRRAVGGGTVIGDRDLRNGNVYIDTVLIVLEYVFGTLNLNRFEANCLTEHKTASKLLRMLHFDVEGSLRQAVYKNGRYYDLQCLALLRDDYYKHLQDGDYEFLAIIKRLKFLR